MKTGFKILLISTLLIGSTYLFIATSFPFVQNKKLKADHPLTKTKWQQMGGFESYTPDHLRLGCWSTALAQIMYYHQLKPFGKVAYISRKGYRINQYIDSNSIDFNQLVLKIDSSTNKLTIEQTARYNYYAALAVQKDFGTDNYMHKLAPASLLEQHYKVKVERYISWKGFLPYTTGKLEKIICSELDSKRPVFLHFSNLKNFGHSVVIDGYYWKNDALVVHLNQGQGGLQDGWYHFNMDILKENDLALRVIYTFKPF